MTTPTQEHEPLEQVAGSAPPAEGPPAEPKKHGRKPKAPKDQAPPADEKEEATHKRAGGGGPEPMPGLIEGRMVHYVLPDGKRRGEHRAAVIAYVHDHGTGLVNLNVFLNGSHDYGAHEHPGNNWLVEKVPFSTEPKAEGHWHWMERA